METVPPWSSQGRSMQSPQGVPVHQAPVPPPPPASGPPAGGQPQPPVAPPPISPRRGVRWGLIAVAAVVVTALMAATAAVTYALSNNDSTPAAPPTTAPPTPDNQQPQFTAAEQTAAKDKVCKIFDDATRAQESQGGVRNNGELNVPLVLRKLNGVVALQSALTPATPPAVADAARNYADTTLALITAVTNGTPADELNPLNTTANGAIRSFVEACELPRSWPQ
jgi:hypothetical protein